MSFLLQNRRTTRRYGSVTGVNMSNVNSFLAAQMRALASRPCTRRNVILASAAGALVGGSTYARQATPASSPVTNNGNGRRSNLVVGVASGQFGDILFPEISLFDSSFSSIGDVTIPDGIMAIYPTGNP